MCFVKPGRNKQETSLLWNISRIGSVQKYLRKHRSLSFCSKWIDLPGALLDDRLRIDVLVLIVARIAINFPSSLDTVSLADL